MKFIDEVVIEVAAGDGGPGASHFRREKFVPLGGPDGGDGGRGGSVILQADENKHTLLDFKFQPRWQAASGRRGDTNDCHGRGGEDLVVSVPVGTEVYRVEDEALVADLNAHAMQAVIARGGRGGRGNAFFKTATNRAPTHAQPGESGERGSFRMSLKLLADVGLIGFPNAGKSTLISRISAARPKIADYPFTTLVPNLGVARASGNRSFVVADIPGLVPGAHAGRGLGTTFLKHVERTRVLAHLIDPWQLSEEGEAISPVQSYEAINQELELYSPELARLPRIIVITKLDTVVDRNALEEQIAPLRKLANKVHFISSVSGQGLEELLEDLAEISLKPAEKTTE